MKIKVRPKKIFSPKGLKATLSEAGYCIFVAEIVDSLDSKYERYDIKLKGNSCSLDPKMVYSVDCKLESSHPQYGDTYFMDFIRPDVRLESPEEIKGFLCMSLGEKKGELLFNEIPDIMNVLEEENVQALCEVKGISAKTATKMIDKYNESKDFANVIGKLKSANLGLTDKTIKKLIKTFKNEETILDMVFNKTYDLVKYIDGWGFKKADEIALRNGTALDSPKRIKACIMHILSENGMKGIEYPSYLEVITQMNEIIGFIAQEPLGIACQELIKEEQVVLINNAEFICSTEYYTLEKRIAKEIDRIGTAIDSEITEKISSIDIKSEIDRAEEVLGFKLAERQKDSVGSIVNGKNVKITVGSAGTGKSSCSKLSLEILEKANLSIALTAFTGKASLRMKEATGFEASTIHRLLAFNPQEGGFQYNSKCKLPYDVILLDEAGMVSAHLFLSLVQAIKDGAILIILGDIKQLVSISSGNILSDLLNSSKDYISKVELNEVQRQKGGSEILDYIQTILDQDSLVNSTFIGRKTFGEKKDAIVDIFTDSGAYVLDWIGTEFKNKLDRRSGNVMDVQILGATRIRGDLSLFNINTKIKSIYNPIDPSRERFIKMMGSKEAPMDYIIEEGDKVVITKNLYKVITVDGEYTSIFNGNLGIVTMVTSENVSVKFDTGDEIILNREESMYLELGYALTCHKCLPKNTYIYTDEGIKTLDYLDNGAKLGESRELSNIKTKVYNGEYLEKPSHFYNNGFSKCLKIKTKKGHEITITPEHEIFRNSESILKEKVSGRELKVGDNLILSFGQAIFGDNTELQLKEPTVDIRATKYKLPMKLTEDVSELLGIIVADGCLGAKMVRVFKRHLDVVERFAYLIEEEFGYKCTIKEGYGTEGWFAEINSVYIRDVLCQIEGLKPNKKDIPQIILNTTEENQCAFLRGLFEDGTVNITKNNKFDHIEFCTKDKHIVDKVSMMLLNIGIVSTIYKKEKNNGFTSYNLYIYKRFSKIFKDKIGFVSKFKKDRLELCAINEKHSCPQDYFLGVKNTLIDIYSKGYTIDYKTKQNILKRDKTSPDFIGRFIKELEVYRGDSYIDNIVSELTFAYNHMFIDSIVSIDIVYEETFCLTMKETHNFVQNGFYGGNCQGSEFKSVIVALDNGAYVLATNEWIYTAVSRGKVDVTVFAQNYIYRQAVKSREQLTKRCLLVKFLNGEIE